MNQQFRYLFISNFVVLFTGMGLFPVLPLYATGLGATPTLVGFYFAIIFGANALGPAVVGRLSHRLSPRSLLVAAGWWGDSGPGPAGHGDQFVAGNCFDGRRLVCRRDKPDRGQHLGWSANNGGQSRALV
jgi:MFS family permease